MKNTTHQKPNSHIRTFNRTGERGIPEGIVLMRGVSLPASALAAGADDDLPRDIMILPAGDFIYTRDGRAVRNPDPGALVEAYNKDTIEIMADISHESVFGWVEPPAQGWIKSMELREGAIWAHIEWTDLGENVLRLKHYRYISPAFSETPEGEISQFVSVGLVNQPAMTMPAVARATPGKSQTLKEKKEFVVDEEQLALLRKNLGLADDASVEDIIAASGAFASKPDDKTDPKDKDTPEGKTDKGNPEADAGTTAEAGGDGAEIDAPSLDEYVPRADYDALASRVAELEVGEDAAPSEEEVSEAVDGAIKAARIAPASRAHYVAMCSTAKGFKAFKAFVKTGPKVVATRPDAGLNSKISTAANLTPAESIICRNMGIKPADYLKNKKGSQ